jgi:predicted alpha/beta hydrolase
MKNRAGTVGGNGVAALLERIHQRRPDMGIHLAGHSFGGRLVSAAAAARQTTPVRFGSMTLMQAAFSHYGFSRNWKDGKDGAFRAVLADHRVTGPVLVTHTGNDKAVGIAYALASRVAGQVAAQLGDRDDIYGGIGRNGALRTPEALDARLLDVGGGYELEPGRLHNLLADRFVGSHSDILGSQVSYAILSAVAAS